MFPFGTLFAVAAVFDFQNASAYDEDDDPANASARIIIYSSTAKIGECWYDWYGTETKLNDVIIPKADIIKYQMKWNSLSGDAPSSYSSAEGIWQALSSNNFWVAWGQTEPGTRTGAVTVSIRKGTGATLHTATWDGVADVAEE